MTTERQFMVYSETTGEYLLPERDGWTPHIERAGLYSEKRADRAAETMLDGERCAISLIEYRR